MIDNQKVDSYKEFGTPELNKDKDQIYLTSEMSEKTYELTIVNANKVLVKYHFFCSECEQQDKEHEKIYTRELNGKWKFDSCKGDC